MARMQTGPATCCLAPLAMLLTACGGGSSSTPLGGVAAPIELMACRARVDSPYQFAEITLRSSQNLGSSRIADRTGTERHARIHPDGNTLVFAREREPGDADSRELFVATIDGSVPELRLTQDADLDDEPCWSPDGDRVLFTSRRGGDAALWRIGRDGTDLQPFLATMPGESDSAPDWCAETDRVVFSRRAVNGRHALWLVQGNGTGAVPLTDGGAAVGLGLGDHAPAFTRDGSRVAFVRRLAPDRSGLCFVDLASGAVTVRWLPDGDVGHPRWAPAMDRVFFGVSEPDRGRATLRLATIPVLAGDPALLWPDERWQLVGLDLMPGLAATPPAEPPRLLPATDAQLQIATATGAAGGRPQLLAADGDDLVLWTATVDDREIAGISCRYDLPVLVADDVLELRIRAVARTSRAGSDVQLRMSIYNPVDERFDTAVETDVSDTMARTLEFRTTSLRHVTRERQLRVTVIGDLPAGDVAELHIDLLQVELIARQRP